MEYNLTREQAAEILWISTRTLDRRIRKWLLSHEKRANKVYLSEEEVRNYNKHKWVNSVILESTTSTSNKTITNVVKPEINTKEIIQKIGQHMDESLGKFLEVLSEKDKKIEEKNQIIFALQQRVGELEMKLKNTVALPLYQEEKKELILEKENLKVENKLLEEELKKEKIKNIAIVWFIVILIVIMLFLFGR
jgi:predicted site-specific integrase-resolvase